MGASPHTETRYLCMMRPTRQTITYALMISSVVLLLVLQIFWLRASYEKAYLDLRRETNDLFRATLTSMRDTLLFKNLEKLPVDSADSNDFTFTHKIDSSGGRVINSKVQFQKSESQIRVYISSTHPSDSLQTVLRPLTNRLQDGGFKSGNFILRLNADSLSLDSIRASFQRALVRNGHGNLFFEVSHRAGLPPAIEIDKNKGTIFRPPFDVPPDEAPDVRVFSNTLSSDWVRFDPMHRYAVTISGTRSALLQEILPQILFSLFLTALTTASFYFMYRSIRAQQRLMELKNDFISNITHELKTPVTTVSVALEALKNFKGLENPKLTSEYLDIAQGELNRLTILTDKILKTAIFENKGVDFKPEPVDLEKLITQILASMRLLFERQKAKVTFEKQGDNFVISGGSIHLTNVIYNLLDNALKYSPGEPAIQVTLKNEEHQIEILVKDEGIGIPAEFRKKVFEKFFRVPTGDVHNIKGYGLGLSYVDSVVRSHRGTIEVLSSGGAGSLFRIVLPK